MDCILNIREGIYGLTTAVIEISHHITFHKTKLINSLISKLLKIRQIHYMLSPKKPITRN